MFPKFPLIAASIFFLPAEIADFVDPSSEEKKQIELVGVLRFFSFRVRKARELEIVNRLTFYDFFHKTLECRFDVGSTFLRNSGNRSNSDQLPGFISILGSQYKMFYTV